MVHALEHVRHLAHGSQSLSATWGLLHRQMDVLTVSMPLLETAVQIVPLAAYLSLMTQRLNACMNTVTISAGYAKPQPSHCKPGCMSVPSMASHDALQQTQRTLVHGRLRPRILASTLVAHV